MPMMRTEKDEKIGEISELFAKAEGVYLADLTGMNVEVVTRFVALAARRKSRSRS
ncbi:MAG: hypothetical protein R3E12_17425 [Candidatus Eisenbacteria bacterium]